MNTAVTITLIICATFLLTTVILLIVQIVQDRRRDKQFKQLNSKADYDVPGE